MKPVVTVPTFKRLAFRVLAFKFLAIRYLARKLLGPVLLALALLASPPPAVGAMQAADTEVVSDSLSNPGDLAPLVHAPHPDLARRASPQPHLMLRLDGPREIPNVNRLLWRPRPQRLNRFQRTLHAADKGAYSALAVGYAGWLTGVWEEDTALWLMGAGAALGAVLGSVSGDLPISIEVGADDRP